MENPSAPYPDLQQVTLQQPAVLSTTITTSSVPGPPVRVGPEPMEVVCPQCRCRVKSEIRHKATTKTHMTCLLLSICFFWTCCCFLPYCIGSCQNTNHFCPMCGTYLGTYES